MRIDYLVKKINLLFKWFDDNDFIPRTEKGINIYLDELSQSARRKTKWDRHLWFLIYCNAMLFFYHEKNDFPIGDTRREKLNNRPVKNAITFNEVEEDLVPLLHRKGVITIKI